MRHRCKEEQQVPADSSCHAEEHKSFSTEDCRGWHSAGDTLSDGGDQLSQVASTLFVADVLCPVQMTAAPPPSRAHTSHRCQQWRQKFGCSPHVPHRSQQVSPLRALSAYPGTQAEDVQGLPGPPQLATPEGPHSPHGLVLQWTFPSSLLPGLGLCRQPKSVFEVVMSWGSHAWCLVRGWHLPTVSSVSFYAFTTLNRALPIKWYLRRCAVVTARLPVPGQKPWYYFYSCMKAVCPTSGPFSRSWQKANAWFSSGAAQSCGKSLNMNGGYSPVIYSTAVYSPEIYSPVTKIRFIICFFHWKFTTSSKQN